MYYRSKGDTQSSYIIFHKVISNNSVQKKKGMVRGECTSTRSQSLTFMVSYLNDPICHPYLRLFTQVSTHSTDCTTKSIYWVKWNNWLIWGCQTDSRKPRGPLWNQSDVPRISKNIIALKQDIHHKLILKGAFLSCDFNLSYCHQISCPQLFETWLIITSCELCGLPPLRSRLGGLQRTPASRRGRHCAYCKSLFA